MDKNDIDLIVALWLPRLYLTHWNVKVDWDEFDEDKNGHAYVWRSRDYDEAKIYINPKFEKWTYREAHLHIVHELVHLITRDFEFVLDMIENQLHRDVYAMVTESHRHLMEQAVDRLSHILVDQAGIT
jgi:hypothetical protein